jgi:accessory gene regulator protein AgrB
MNQFNKILIILVSIMFIGYFVTSIFSFFNIGIQSYGIYLLFVIALLLLYAFLPQKTGEIFSK